MPTKKISSTIGSITSNDIVDVFAVIDKCLCPEFVPYIKGPSGIGKTMLSEQMAQRRGWLFEPYDCTYADFADWGLYTKMEDKDGPYVEACIPRHMDWLFNATMETLVLVDELPLAPELIQGNLMALFNQRHIRGRRISEYVHFIVAGNRPQDKVGGNAIKWPLASRVAVFNAEFGPASVKSWGNYMRKKGIPSTYTSAVLDQPSMLTDAEPNTVAEKRGGDPRAWDRALSILTGTGINCGTASGRNDARALVASYVGDANAQQFIGYVKNHLDIPDISALLQDPKNHPLPDDPDKLYSLGNSLAFHASNDNIETVIAVIERVPPELQQRILKDLLNRKPHLFTEKAVVAFNIATSTIQPK